MKINFYYPENVEEIEEKIIEFLSDLALQILTPQEIELLLSTKDIES